MASEKIVLSIPAVDARMHTGGAMQFDAQGNLWIGVGDNGSGEEGPSNTNDLRGKLLRIRPTPEGTYTIPGGNLFPPGTAKTRPEIFIMGSRNPYSLGMDALRNRVAWGDVGPDGFGVTEEHNLTDQPGFYGWPYFAGDNVVLVAGKNPAAPVNNQAGNTGLANLPAAKTAVNSYAQAAAISGPVYRYDGASESKVKLPPHFDGRWFVADFNRNTLDTVSLNEDGTRKAQGRVFSHVTLTQPIDLQIGPDGALYIINYAGWFNSSKSTTILRIDYMGTCRPNPLSGRKTAPPGMFSLRGMMA
jgi:cytochrome c